MFLLMLAEVGGISGWCFVPARFNTFIFKNHEINSFFKNSGNFNNVELYIFSKRAQIHPFQKMMLCMQIWTTFLFFFLSFYKWLTETYCMFLQRYETLKSTTSAFSDTSIRAENNKHVHPRHEKVFFVFWNPDLLDWIYWAEK